eukprot:11377729-Alexandrium_andersonii.AAC.1
MHVPIAFRSSLLTAQLARGILGAMQDTPCDLRRQEAKNESNDNNNNINANTSVNTKLAMHTNRVTLETSMSPPAVHRYCLGRQPCRPPLSAARTLVGQT